MDQAREDWSPHSAHWGAFSARWNGATLDIRPYEEDPAPSPILQNFTTAMRHKARILRPMVRKAWLDRSAPSERTFDQKFVACPWDEVLDLLANELSRIRTEHGAAAVFGGSYGWSSAGRFHHAQSQVHRFLNMAFGGYVRSVNSYSAGASAVILPHVLGGYEAVSRHNVTWDQVAEHTDTVLAFGGMALKNSDVASGGISRHIERDAMQRAARRGAIFYGIAPVARRHAGRSRRPVAADQGRHRRGADAGARAHAARRKSVGQRLCRALLHRLRHLRTLSARPRRSIRQRTRHGRPILPAFPLPTIVDLARRLPRGRTLITVSHSLQRAQYGEQPVWMGAVLAAMLGQIGLPGGGYNYALGALGHTGRRLNAVPIPTLSQGKNGISDFIPVARVADMLLHPGERFEYNGRSMQYPDIKLVYWAGGNPFHHHQDINRLRRAFNVPQTIVVHESAWTPMAKFADIVLPATMTLERDDIGAAGTDPRLVAMRRAVDPVGEARDDFDIFAALSRRLGVEQAFTEGRNSRQWLAHLYEPTRRALADAGWDAPDFEEFWQRGELALPSAPDDGGFLRAFRNDPVNNKLPTPSGKIEIYSKTIAGFGYDDCPPHPAWLPSTEPPDSRHPLTLIANQPATRLHSQLDFGAYSQSKKIAGREAVRLNPVDAGRRGIADGDIVRLFNDRGACLAAAAVTDDVMPGVVQLSTGAWYDPQAGAAERSALRPRQSERAHPRHRHIAARARLLRPGDGGRVREV